MAMIEQKIKPYGLDRKIIAPLVEDGRITWAQPAAELGLSALSVTEGGFAAWNARA